MIPVGLFLLTVIATGWVQVGCFQYPQQNQYPFRGHVQQYPVNGYPQYPASDQYPYRGNTGGQQWQAAPQVYQVSHCAYCARTHYCQYYQGGYYCYPRQVATAQTLQQTQPQTLQQTQPLVAANTGAVQSQREIGVQPLVSSTGGTNGVKVRSCNDCARTDTCTVAANGDSYCYSPLNVNPSTTFNGVDVCSLVLSTGSCTGGMYTRFYYDSRSGMCLQFRYGGDGCGGNGNRFTSLSSCQKTCVKTYTQPASQTQTLTAANTEIVQTQTQVMVEPLVLSGSGGTNGVKVDNCRYCAMTDTCSTAGNGDVYCYSPLVVSPSTTFNGVDVCSLPLSLGNCQSGMYIRYYYDNQSGTCLQFRYGGYGCGGNGNRFTSLSLCRKTCMGM